MKSDKVVRQIDELGRVVIPRDMRRELGLSCGDKICFESEDNKIILSRLEMILSRYENSFAVICRTFSGYVQQLF